MVSQRAQVGKSESKGVGGLMGRIRGGVIKNCYTVGEVTADGEYRVGALAGQNNGKVENSYYNEGIFPDCKEGGEGINTFIMMLQGTYKDWDFEDTWDIIIEESYPYLQWQDGANIPAP